MRRRGVIRTTQEALTRTPWRYCRMIEVGSSVGVLDAVAFSSHARLAGPSASAFPGSPPASIDTRLVAMEQLILVRRRRFGASPAQNGIRWRARSASGSWRHRRLLKRRPDQGGGARPEGRRGDEASCRPRRRAGGHRS